MFVELYRVKRRSNGWNEGVAFVQPFNIALPEGEAPDDETFEVLAHERMAVKAVSPNPGVGG